MTLREIVYMIMDELKLMSDDSSFNEDHIKFLIHKHRVLLLNQYYEGKAKAISESNYQTINVELDIEEGILGVPCSGKYLKSEYKIPNTLTFSNNRIYTNDIKNYRVSHISRDRFKFIGFNKWTSNIIYSSLIDNYLYLYSNNNQFYNLERVKFSGIFEDVELAEKISSDKDILDMEYPIESGLVPLLIQSVVQELAPKTIQPEDSYNNASDDKANIANYIARNQKQNAQ